MFDDITEIQGALLSKPAALAKLEELRGWSEPAIRRLGLGLMGDRVAIPVYDPRGALVGLIRYQPNPAKRGDQPKSIATPGSDRELFPPVETLDKDATIWVVEGEPDSVAAHSVGLEATGIGGSGGWKDDYTARFAGRHVVVCCDCDAPGRTLAIRVAEALYDVASSVRVLDLDPLRDDGHDLSDLVMEAAPDERAGVGVLLQRMADDTPVYVRDQDRPPRPRMSLPAFKQAAIDHLDGKATVPAWPLPFRKLNELTDGGIRPGELWVVSGWTSHGKSTFADQLGDSVTEAGASVHVYQTEMSGVQRALRAVSRMTGIRVKDLRRPERMSQRQREIAKAAVHRLPYAATNVTEWEPEHVVADIRSNRTNVAIVDLVHGFSYHDERSLARIVTTLKRAATGDAAGQAGTAVVLVAHLNDTQMRDARSPKRPRPGLHSLKGSKTLNQDPDVVLFVYREDDEHGQPTDDGEIIVAKQRNGELGHVPVTLNPDALRFEEQGSGAW